MFNRKIIIHISNSDGNKVTNFFGNSKQMLNILRKFNDFVP